VSNYRRTGGAQPGRQVISLSGDGGFSMLMGDLFTLSQMKVPVKVVIFNNGVLGFVALEMKAAGFVDTNVDLKNPDFAAMARAMGIFARRVEDPGELPAAMKEMLSHARPALLDVVTAKQELSMPPTITPEAVRGFSLCLLRAVMSGRGEDKFASAVATFSDIGRGHEEENTM
jgi:pyruvate dehydrogenase (quinone)